ncbi:MAG: zinc ribbon domain-containing protein [Phycisphaerae bacterium]|nr:zinc ribbon domain-containing protein [Phycisphaerae bacterium]
MNNKRIDPDHEGSSSALKTIGPLMIVIGGIFAIIGFVSFFSAFGGGGPPRYFWCAFIGMPLIGIGTMICKFAYMGKIARFMADEIAPVGKDTFNYMAHGTKDSVRDLASAVGEGLGFKDASEEKSICHQCNKEVDKDAKFCQECGAEQFKPKPCSSCGQINDPNAKFCDNCGNSF